VITSAIPNSIAVLPFTNLSDDKQNEYFSDGISEELLTTLQKITALQVAARTSSFSFKGPMRPRRRSAAKLGVSHLVEGSVRKAGQTVRITARLSNASTGEQLWSDAYTRDLKDVFQRPERAGAKRSWSSFVRGCHNPRACLHKHRLWTPRQRKAAPGMPKRISSTCRVFTT
jgi:TolB-like protein